MPLPRAVPALLVAVFAVAGCAAAPADDAAAPEADFTALDLQATATTGVLRGAVVDDAIRPLAAAHVVVNPGNRSVTTTEDGAFGLDGLAPGTYFLTASKPGYASVQATAEVVAGIAEPKGLLVMLARLPGSEPFVAVLAWDGYMQCSFTVAIAFGTGCLIGDFTNDNSRKWDPVDGTPDWLQSELDWTPTQALGSNLCMRHYASESVGGAILGDDVCGGRPLLQAYNHTRLNETEIGTTQGLERVVWVDDFAADATLGLALEQRFSVYTHLFYNFLPDEGWTFIADGPHPTPA